ncbi:MAG: tetratricopeptide repeat protein [Planctomycetota bacterium]
MSALVLAVATWSLPAAAFVQDGPPSPPKKALRSAPALVREANQLLLDNQPKEALDRYRQAEEVKPDAREIAFDRGLSHYRLGEFDAAREAFRRAGEGADALADDAAYGLGTCDHAEALASTQDPKLAMSKLENAMRAYHDVLKRDRTHEAARDANLKAASMWRKIKQQLEQQQSQQPSDQQDPSDENQEQDKSQEQDQQKQQQAKDQQQTDASRQQEDQPKQQAQDEPSPEQQENASDRQQSSKDESSENQQEEQNEAQSGDQHDEQSGDAKPAGTDEEQVPREQAERRLREMMQSLRDRGKVRRQEVRPAPTSKNDKDW